MAQREIINIAKKYLDFLKKEKFQISKAYLFGSYAKGTNGTESDIDIAFIFNELKDEIDMQIQLMKLRRKFDLRIEPHPFEKKDLDEENPFLNEILQTGILI
ncbi:MAG: nucleotidyltransferase domain-containing protein [Candidatus Tenebribacter mawsonii]|nr:nucleotidyltransferase domain-containing protein [Candidatus Tenebribacter mawsonii]